VANLDTAEPARSRTRWFAYGFAAVGTVLGFLPLANWIPGGHGAPWYSAFVSEWISGSAIVVGVAVVLAILSRRTDVLWREGLGQSLSAWAHDHATAFGVGIAFTAFVVYAAIASSVFSRVPISIDELVQLVQAKTFVSGRLWQPTSPNPEFYSILNVVDLNGRYYGQFPPGGPAMLSLGLLFGAAWLIGPVCGAVSVAAFWTYVRVVEPRRGVGVGAVVVFALAPFTAFMSGSHMNHVPSLMWLVLAMAAMARTLCSTGPRPSFAFASGLALGCAATIRPVDAFAFALPAGLWYAANALGARARWRDLVASGVGVAIPVAVMMWVNARTTGEPLLFGYQVLWGRSHDLGFHRAPWGIAHTPARGLELINLYFLRLQTYLFEASIPSLLPALGALFLTRRVDRFDRYLLVSAALVVGLYFAYWHDGFLFGPRFVFALLPLLALWTARFPAVVRERFGQGTGYRATWYALGVAAALAAFVSVPARAREYGRSFIPMRLDYLAPARMGGVENAVILVRESWGTQLMARLWALGVPRSETELLYGKVDACALERRVSEIERGTARDTVAFRMLAPLLADSARVVKSPFSPDVTERYLPGSTYADVCAQRINDDRVGFGLLAPLLYRDWGTNVYARDMHDRNRSLLRRYADRPVYLLRPASNEIGASLRLFPLRRDSLVAVWGETEPIYR
jgi:hypothetical protein